MDTATRPGAATIIGARLRKARKAKSLTQEQLAAPQFTKGYVSALERGAVRPSLKALEHFASRLELPLSYFVSGVEMGTSPDQESGLLREPDVEAVQEDLNYQYNYARMLIRNGDPKQIEQALDLISNVEQSSAAYAKRLPARLRYRPHFLRGLAYLRRSELERGIPEFERALQEAGSDEQAEVTVRNMFGVAYYLMQQPSTALHHHLRCLYAVESGSVKDLSLKLSILHNIANDYWALHDMAKAIDAYRRALPLVEDLNGLDRQANTLWALGMAYRAANDWAQAKLYATRALTIYEALDDMSGAASVCLHLAELFTQDARYRDAEEMLAKARRMLEQSNDQVLLSTLHTDYASLYRKQGQLKEAARHAGEGVSLVSAILTTDESASGKDEQESTPSVPNYPPINVTRAHVEALQEAALIAEEQGSSEEADRMFGEAQRLVEGTELVELAHTVAFSYAEVLSARGDFASAAQQYRASAQAVHTRTQLR